jgi:hypothetical protein
MKFKEMQQQKVKHNDYEFKENDLVLIRVENNINWTRYGTAHMK